MSDQLELPLFPLGRIRRHCHECGSPINRQDTARFVPGGQGRPRRRCDRCSRARAAAQKRLWREVEIATRAIRVREEREAEAGDFKPGKWEEGRPDYTGDVILLHPALCDVAVPVERVVGARKGVR
jgi:hypothetical protein